MAKQDARMNHKPFAILDADNNVAGAVVFFRRMEGICATPYTVFQARPDA